MYFHEQKQMFLVYMQLIFVVGTSLLEVLMWAIPADHLSEMVSYELIVYSNFNSKFKK